MWTIAHMIIAILDYMHLTKGERQNHLDLNLPCDERGGNSTNFKALLSHNLGVEIPENGQFNKIQLGHACNNGKCSNWRHLYYATASENVLDSGTCSERTIKKHGKDIYKIVNKRLAEKRGKQAFSDMGKMGRGKKKSPLHRKKISEAIKKWHNVRGV